jgi:hypothetical protein
LCERCSLTRFGRVDSEFSKTGKLEIWKVCAGVSRIWGQNQKFSPFLKRLHTREADENDTRNGYHENMRVA